MNARPMHDSVSSLVHSTSCSIRSPSAALFGAANSEEAHNLCISKSLCVVPLCKGQAAAPLGRGLKVPMTN